MLLTYLDMCVVFPFPQGLVKFLWEWGSIPMAKQPQPTSQVPGQMACCPWNRAHMGLKTGKASCFVTSVNKLVLDYGGIQANLKEDEKILYEIEVLGQGRHFSEQ